jgi:hypothetical protein
MVKSLCANHWSHLYLRRNGDITPCCEWTGAPYQGGTIEEILPGAEAAILREQSRTDGYIDGCKVCYRLEAVDNPFPSNRLLINQKFPVDVAAPPRLRSLQIELGALCNNSCIMCESSFSTRWVRDEVAMGVAPSRPVINSSAIDRIRTSDISDVESLKFTGGEPFLYEEEIMETIARCRKVKRLLIVTNTTTVPSERFVKFLKTHVERLILTLSIEAMGEKNDYLRYGSNWKEVSEIAMLLTSMHPNQGVHVKSVIQSLNVLELPALEGWLRARNIALYLGALRSKMFLDAGIYGDDFKNEVVSRCSGLSQSNLNVVSTFLRQGAFDPEQIATFMTYTKTLDRLRGVDSRAIFPEFFELCAKHQIDF